jgi:hypothetical protein
MCECCPEGGGDDEESPRGRDRGPSGLGENKINIKILKSIIQESIREVITEQNQQEIDDCHTWYTNDNSSYVSFMSDCCEGPEGCLTVGSQTCGAWSTIANSEGVQDACQCCDIDTSIWTTGGEIDCTNSEWIHANSEPGGLAERCYVCQKELQTCDMLANIPMTVATAQGLNLTLFQDLPTCNAQSECGPGTGDNCDPTDGTYYGFGTQNPDPSTHNPLWGKDCWFCKEDAMPGCTEITTPMLQGEAFATWQAGDSDIYADPANCNAIEKCGDDNTGGKMVECFCCDGQNAQSMVQQVPAVPGCSALNGGNLSGCVLHTNSGGTWDPKMCIKPGGPINDFPTGQSLTRPGANNIKKSLQELIKRKR